MRQACPEERKNDMLECFAIADCKKRFSACIKRHNEPMHRFFACNLHATKFSSLEELAVNLQLKFLDSMIDMISSVECSTWYDASSAYEIMGIKQEVLRECISSGKCLL